LKADGPSRDILNKFRILNLMKIYIHQNYTRKFSYSDAVNLNRVDYGKQSVIVVRGYNRCDVITIANIQTLYSGKMQGSLILQHVVA
jgi:hypothetical protein